jgi:glycosyltransferase involved in cell wall biosynthesis
MAKYLVTVIIPCFNEAEGITKVIKGFHKGLLIKDVFAFDILVVDNDSSDDTANVARKAGARVITETKRGKGNAMITGFAHIHPKADYVMMIDGDNTYRPEEALRMLEPLHSNFCDVVVGSRLAGRIRNGAMTPLNRGGNWIFAHMVRIIYHLNVTDVFSGYFAWKREIIDEIAPHFHAAGFAIEMEMITKMAKMKCQVNSVPISLHLRTGQSSLRPFHDGAKILKTFTRNLTWKYTGAEPEQYEEES